MAAHERIVTMSVVPLDFTYNYRVGPYLEKYIQGLGEKELFGVKCPDCDMVAVPPRKKCGTCYKSMEEIVEVGPEGEVVNYTVGHVKVNKGLVEKLDSPQLLAMVMLDGATVPLLAEIKGLAPGDLKNGLKVKAVFQDPSTDSLRDLSHFEPVG